jgi:GPH family glycoside/pentoside/hexuronide:cation symporter
MAGTVMMTASIIDYIVSPLSGAVISGTRPMKWGRIRSWLLVAPPLIIPFYLLQFSNLGNGAVAAIIISLGYVISHTMWNIAFTADVALIAEIAPSREERLKLGSNRMLYNNLGRMFSNYLTPTILVALTALFASEAMGYSALVFCSTIIMFLCFLSDFLITKGYERQTPEDAKADKPKQDRVKFRELIAVFKKNGHLLALMIADLTSNVGSFLLPALAVYYYKYVAVNMGLLKYHLFFMSFGGLLGAFLSGHLFHKVYKKRVVMSIYFLITGLLVVSRVFAYQPYFFIAFQTVMQFFVGMSQPLEIDLYMDTGIYHEWKSGKSVTSFIMGLVNIPVKVSIIVKSIVLTLSFLAVGYVPGANPTPEMQQGIVNAYVFVPAIIPIIGAISLGFFYKLNPERVAMMQAEIAERNSKP